ncbi:MAG TPA: hypothetical protein PLU50_05875 [Pseudobdellovibrionaceae bacterium]|nr:hypothetical protein [Pseudobdellovibrionaceae bacterium]
MITTLKAVLGFVIIALTQMTLAMGAVNITPGDKLRLESVDIAKTSKYELSALCRAFYQGTGDQQLDQKIYNFCLFGGLQSSDPDNYAHLGYLGFMQYHGIGVEKNETKGLASVRESVNRRSAVGSYLYARIFCDDSSDRFSPKICEDHLILSAMLGEPRAALMLARFYKGQFAHGSRRGHVLNGHRVVQYLERAISLGSAEAFEDLACFYSSRNCANPNYPVKDPEQLKYTNDQKAAELFLKCTRFSSTCNWLLSKYYMDGLGSLPRDAQKAKTIADRAAAMDASSSKEKF